MMTRKNALKIIGVMFGFMMVGCNNFDPPPFDVNAVEAKREAVNQALVVSSNVVNRISEEPRFITLNDEIELALLWDGRVFWRNKQPEVKPSELEIRQKLHDKGLDQHNSSYEDKVDALIEASTLEDEKRVARNWRKL